MARQGTETEINIWKIEIRQSGHRLGWLYLEKGAIYWKPANKRAFCKLPWKKFDKLMRENG